MSKQNKQSKPILYWLVFDTAVVKSIIAFLFAFFFLNPTLPAFAADDEVLTEDDSFTEQQASAVTEAPAEEDEEEPKTQIDDTGPEIESEKGSQDSEKAETEEAPEIQIIIDDESGQKVSSGVFDPEESVTEVEFENEATTTLENTDVLVEVSTSTEVSHNLSTSTDTSLSKSGEDELADISTTTTEVPPEVATSTETSTDVSTSTENADNGYENLDSTDSNEEIANNTSTSTSTTAVNTENEDEKVIDDSDEEAVDDAQATSTTPVETQLATSTPTTSEKTVNVLGNLINDENRHQFSIDECISVGDGSFYCSEADSAPEYLEDAIFTAPDKDGDMEIFVRVAGEEVQISDNLVDDGSPYYDSKSERIVWHSLVNDRYQIVSYNFDDGKTKTLTATNYNNMEPVAQGGMTLWQAWIEDNWEIMMFDGKETLQLTDNETHDVSPHMRGEYIMWQTQFADGWQVAMYDIESEKVDYIGAGDGAQVENPRFVLVYDALGENGDVETLGYDFDSGETIPLNRLPTRLPEKLPDPESTGETRALIQNKTTSKDSEVIDLEPEDGLGETSSTSSLRVATSTAKSATDSSSNFSDPSSSTSGLIMEQATTTKDVIVTPHVSDTNVGTTTVQVEDKVEHIDDMIIPPLATSTDEVLG